MRPRKRATKVKHFRNDVYHNGYAHESYANSNYTNKNLPSPTTANVYHYADDSTNLQKFSMRLPRKRRKIDNTNTKEIDSAAKILLDLRSIPSASSSPCSTNNQTTSSSTRSYQTSSTPLQQFSVVKHPITISNPNTLRQNTSFLQNTPQDTFVAIVIPTQNLFIIFKRIDNGFEFLTANTPNHEMIRNIFGLDGVTNKVSSEVFTNTIVGVALVNQNIQRIVRGKDLEVLKNGCNDIIKNQQQNLATSNDSIHSTSPYSFLPDMDLH